MSTEHQKDYEDMRRFQGMVIKLTHELNTLKAKLEKAEAALEKIYREEINSQRPGGYYSVSARISYDALKEIRGRE